MSRLVRHLLALLFAFVLALSAGSARAQEITIAPPSAGASEAAPVLPPVLPVEGGPALTLPNDVPVLPPGQVTIPRIPADYATHDFGWLKLAYPESAKERVEPILKSAESVRAELTAALGQRVLDHVELRIVPSTVEMNRLAPVGAPPPAYASGVAYPRLRLTLISMLAPRGGEATNLEQVFRHELLHLALEDAVRGQHVPAWFNEGLAVLYADENGLDRQRALFNATISGKLLPLAELDHGFPHDNFEVNIAYAESVDFVHFLRRRSDELRFAMMIARVREGQPFERALAQAYGSDVRKLEFQWRSDLERRYSIIPVLAGGGLIWVAVIAALGWGYVKKRRRAKAILAKWAEEEAIEDALLAQRAAQRAEESAPDLSKLPATARPSTKIEHAGSWHTLH